MEGLLLYYIGQHPVLKKWYNAGYLTYAGIEFNAVTYAYHITLRFKGNQRLVIPMGQYAHEQRLLSRTNGRRLLVTELDKCFTEEQLAKISLMVGPNIDSSDT